MLLAALWVAVMYEPQWLLASRGITVGLKAPVLLYLALAGMLVIGVPSVPRWQRGWTWYAPLLAFTLVHFVTVPLAPNPLLAREATQSVFLFWVMVVATATLVDSPRRAELLVKGFAAQFLLWGVLGGAAGLVAWHTFLSNYDGYGSFMVIGGGMCSFLIFASDDKRFRRAMAVAVMLCAVGVVASFARGALLAAIVVGGVAWLRSPRKGAALAAVVGCLVIVVVASSLLYGAEYWAEMATIADGTEEATGEDRWEMWKAAWQVFLQHPLFGTGAKNWGVFASTYFQPGDLGGDYAENPMMLYNKSLHSSYFQVLAEHGLFGVVTFTWIIWDFWQRNVVLRTEAAGRAWKQMGGQFELKSLALAIEAAFIGWLASAALYSQNGSHWFYTILAMNLVVHRLAVRAMASSTAPQPRRAPARVRGFRQPAPAGQRAVTRQGLS